MAAAIVLAGGGSRRMGRDKAWLELEGQTLLARVIELLAGRCAPIVVSARPGQVLPEVVGIEVWRVDDPTADAGPLVGLHGALERLAAAGVTTGYLGSCDAAALSERHVELMLERLRTSSGAIAAVPVESDGRRHPLAAALDVVGMRARTAAQLAAHDQRLQTLFRGPGIVAVPVAELPDPEVLAPCNTPEQWAALLTRLGVRR
jgi:molybdopterin-guanine dinucleotide biosynthesis protein A